MAKRNNRVSKKKGLPPGSLVHVGEQKTEDVSIKTIEYNEKGYIIRDVEHIEAPPGPLPQGSVRWIDVAGLHRVDIIEQIGAAFDIHPLVMEDILNTNQRPKFENWDDYGFFVLKLMRFDERTDGISSEQVSLLLKDGLVISFQEGGHDDFIPVINRVLNEQGPIRKAGADYLLYSILDLIIDNYFTILEKTGEIIERLEDETIGKPGRATIKAVHSLKREMMLLRKSVWPLREVISRVERQECPLITSGTLVYFKDIHDHIIQIVDTVELYRDMLSSLVDIYLSSVNNRMSQVMKLLTMITTIFIPLSFITGIYGMNFRLMPGLDSPLGFYLTLAAMLLIALLMTAYFKIKKWF
ncbi:MAG TPA: magnesium/cobalt transporter CorA [Spirochaetes bacterium]|nr:magnesium/cobalt transporter CorA [Spirochaetota bacterium]